MEKSMTWQAIAALTTLERKHLGQWLRNEYQSRKPELVQLFDLLSKSVHKGETMDRDTTIAALQNNKKAAKKPSKIKEDLQLRLQMTELLQATEQFLALRLLQENPVKTELTIARAYRKRGLDKHFLQRLGNAAKQLEQQPHRHAGFFQLLSEINYERYQYLSAGQRTAPLNLQAVSDSADLAYMAHKLRVACFARTHQTVFKTEYDLGLLDLVLDFVAKRPSLLQQPAIGLYYSCYQFLKNSTSDSVFYQFKNQLILHRALFPIDEIRNLFLLAINYCIKRINQMERSFLKETLDLYKSGLEGDLLLENGQLSPFAFNNIVAIAIREGDLAWSATFVEQYHAKLELKNREANYHLNLARIAFAHQNYPEALLHLQKADYKDLHNNMISKILQIKVFYLMQEIDVLDAHLQSMEAFVRRQRIFGYHKINYLNIVKYAKKLAMHNPTDRSEREKLAAKIAAEPHFTEREWFLEQLQ
jgi:hypothetical protein